MSGWEATKPTLSHLASFDDLCRCMQVFTDGSAEEELLRVLQVQEKLRMDCIIATSEAERTQKELDASLQSMADLETKLFHARRLLEIENKARRKAEEERDLIERKMLAVVDVLQNENNLKNETKDKLACAIDTFPRKRKSIRTRIDKYGNEINTTGSFLSDLSLSYSEDDLFESRLSKGAWHKHRPSVDNAVPYVGGNRKSRRSSNTGNNIGEGMAPTTPVSTNAGASSRRSIGRSGGRSNVVINDHHIREKIIDSGLTKGDRICATTKVSIPPDGSGIIRAESTIETVPINGGRQKESSENTEERCKEQEFQIKRSETISPLKQSHANNVIHFPANEKGSILGSAGRNLAKSNSQKTGTLKRPHNFVSKTFIRAETCLHCQKKIRFGSVGLRCRDCTARCHIDCRNSLSMFCVPQSNTPTSKGLMGSLSDYAPLVPPLVPALIIHCVNEIESRGLREVGIYRVSGPEREIKSLKERFLRGKTAPHLTNLDVHVLCGCIKDFLRSLREPLIPTALWKDFCNAVQNPFEEHIQKDLKNIVGTLPRANRDTLAFLAQHFQHVAAAPDVLMPFENIARIFGPTIVGYSSLDPDQHAILSEVHTQYTVMLNLLKLPSEFWDSFINLDGDKENIPKYAPCTPNNHQQNKEVGYSLYGGYATSAKSTIKKRKFYDTPSSERKKL